MIDLDGFGIRFAPELIRILGAVLALVGLVGAGFVLYPVRGKFNALNADGIGNLIFAVVGIVIGVAIFLFMSPGANSPYVRYYGVIVVSGAVAGAYVSTLEARRYGLNTEYVWDALIWCLIGGVIGARLYHVLTPSASMVIEGVQITTRWYFQNPGQIFAVWNGGLGIPGGVVGGVLALWIYTRYHDLNFGTWLDIGAPALLLAQAVGRWGNYVNQELYGSPTDLPWAIYIEPAYRTVPGSAGFETFHPLFLYESILNLLGVVLVLWLARRFGGWLKSGDIFVIYLMIYPAIRFFLEFIRLDRPQFGNLNINQALMGVVAVAAAIALAVRHRRQRRVGSAVS